jgi:hypothetical protein
VCFFLPDVRQSSFFCTQGSTSDIYCVLNDTVCSENGYCDPDASVCVCDYGYAGTYCDACDKGFVFDVATGLCTSCPPGSTGQYVCDMCRDGYTVNQWQRCVKCPRLAEAVGTFVVAVALPIAALVVFVWMVNTKLLALCSTWTFVVSFRCRRC